ncbi:MAG: citrate lyase acyl carrier protein [Synergistaceae bacterium]|jgi:citrate lyase subunit gamma (acyl carrier protein)|nr:citrate lyase acyl carrier protein [Synergistaceae bacterium]
MPEISISKTASAGSVESSDCLVTVTPADSIEIDYSGANKKIFEKRTEAMTRAILAEYSVTAGRVHIQDQGAIEITLRARIETAVERALEARLP